MEKSESIANLAKALVKFQGGVGKIKKDSKNPFFKSMYASLANILDVIQEPLAEAGLAVSQMPDGEEALTTILFHAESGEYLQSTYSLHAAKKDPQGIGSAITYARRYALGALLNLNIDEDDDGNAASGNGPGVGKSTDNVSDKRMQDDIRSAIASLHTLKTHETLAEFVAAKPEFIRKDAQFQEAARGRKGEIQKNMESAKNAAVPA